VKSFDIVSIEPISVYPEAKVAGEKVRRERAMA